MRTAMGKSVGISVGISMGKLWKFDGKISWENCPAQSWTGQVQTVRILNGNVALVSYGNRRWEAATVDAVVKGHGKPPAY